jgi:hypothetical protein
VPRERFERWVERYERAWRTPGTDALGELFRVDASYSTIPYKEPYRGLEAIAAMWDAEREGPDEAFEMTSEIVATEGDTAVARVEVRYGEPVNREYRDLWVITLGDDDLCSAFEEWPFAPPGQPFEHA